MKSNNKTAAKSHRKIFIIVGIIACLMFGFCFAMVPLYNLFCKATGVNTTVAGSDLLTKEQALAGNQHADLTRTIKVQFVATNHDGMPWDFYPQTKAVQVHPGQNATVYFHAKNTTEKLMTVQAIPSMTPIQALGHFHKIECFCFHQQTLKAGESKEMALVFQVDKDLPKDLRVITLAYTLFDTTANNQQKATAKG
jgi:cytochrome c oxidase assembly protein subunit 11